MKIQYCLPIIKKSKEEVLRIIEKNNSIYQYFEVWLETIDSVDNDFVEKIVTIAGEKLILLFGRENIQSVKLPMTRKQQIISHINKRCLIDLDVTRDKDILEVAQANIISYHNYQETPDMNKLKEIIDTMMEYQAEIVKVSTMCIVPNDAVRLLEILLDLKSKGQKCIVLGMGEHGTVTRVFGTLWGNELIYAPQIIDEQSAPGQLTKQQLETIFNNLQK